jgi:serine/threonine-protein kinase
MADLQAQLQSALGDAFRLEREITGGGMSRLFLATEASLNRQVVIKLLPPEMTSDVSAARFKQEIELAAQLQHPNILPVLTAGAHDDLIYYVMPYVAGESLRHRLTTQGQLPVEDARTILKEVADALAYAHARGVVHRDIKPENILLQQGHAVLTDFGVARAVAEAQSGGRLTQTGMAVGTPGYMSPEQVAGEAHVDARADVYSLAVVAYELLTGQQPFTGASIQAVLAAHLTEAAKPVTDIRAETPPELSTTIAKALAKNPGERLQTAADFRDAIAVRTGDVAVDTRGRRKRWVGLGMAVAFLAVAAVVLWPRGWHVDGDPRQSLVVFPFENQTGDAALDWLEDASMNLLGLGLAHWEDLRVFDDERTGSLMRRRGVESAGGLDFDLAQDMAMDANVGTLVLGDFRYEGDSLVVQGKIHDVASGTRLSTEIVRAGRGDDPRSVFDAMVGRILNLSGAPVGERPGVTAQTTHSLEAYRLYLTGVEQLQQFQLDSSQALLERAVAFDSTFAMAYLQLHAIDGWRSGGDAAYKLSLLDDARRYSENLPPRYRAFIDIYTAAANQEWARSGELAAEMISRDSADAKAWYEYGEALFHDAPLGQGGSFGNQGKALRAFERTLALDSAMVIAYRHIMDVLASCDNRIANVPSGQTTFVCLADSAVYGTRIELEALLGVDEIERLRVESEEALIQTARQWVAAAPNAYQARDRYLLVAINKGRYQEAENQTAILRERGDRWLRPSPTSRMTGETPTSSNLHSHGLLWYSPPLGASRQQSGQPIRYGAAA